MAKYDKVQAKYFEDLAKANSVDEYNDVNKKEQTELNAAQDELIQASNSLSE